MLYRLPEVVSWYSFSLHSCSDSMLVLEGSLFNGCRWQADIIAAKCKLIAGRQRWDQTRGTTVKRKRISAIEITRSSVVHVLTWQYALITLGVALRDQETDGTLWVQTVHGRNLCLVFLIETLLSPHYCILNLCVLIVGFPNVWRFYCVKSPPK